MDYSPRGSSMHGIFPSKDTGVGCHLLLQGIFPTQYQTCLSCIAGRFFTTVPPWKPQNKHPSIPILGIYSKELKTGVQVNTCTYIFITQRWRQLRCALADEWINQMWYRRTMGYYSVQKKKWRTYACNSVDKAELWKHYTKWKKPDTKLTYSAISFIWNIQGR